MVREDNEFHFYQKKLWNKEWNIVNELYRLFETAVTLPFKEEYRNINKGELELGFEQKNSLDMLSNSGLKVLIGGPGTGKTTVIKKIVKTCYKMDPNAIISLCAPTGRAAVKINESTGYTAKTIHKMLEYLPYGEDNETKYNKTNPLLSDVIIIDEFSMVDTDLFAAFLGSIKDGALLILVGDWNKLPSVGAGNLLFDIVNSKLFPVYELTEIHRQKEGNVIIENSHKIMEGNCDLIQNESFKIFSYSSIFEIKEKVKELMYNNYSSYNVFKTQLLYPTKKNEGGVFDLNELCQSLFKNNIKGIMYGNTLYSIGDKVILTRNNYKTGYINGYIGTIFDLDKKGIYVKLFDSEILFIENIIEKKCPFSCTKRKDLCLRRSFLLR